MPVANIGVRSVDFVAQTEVQRQVRGDAEFILRIPGRDPLAKPAVELAAALEELHRLPQQETGEGIAGGERSEHEEAVGGDSEQDVDLLAVQIGAEFQVMPAARHGDRVRSLIVVLISVLRPGNRIAKRRVAADDQIGNAVVESQRGLVIESQAAARRVILRLAVQKYIAEEREPNGLHGLRTR